MDKHIFFYSMYCPHSMTLIQTMVQKGVRGKFLLVSLDKYDAPDGVDRVPYIITREKRHIFGPLIDMFINALASSSGEISNPMATHQMPTASPTAGTFPTVGKPAVSAGTKDEIQPIDFGTHGFTYLDEDVNKKSEMNNGSSVLGFVYLEDGASTNIPRAPPPTLKTKPHESTQASYSSHVFTPTSTPSDPMLQDIQDNPYGVSDSKNDKITDDAFKRFLEARNSAIA